MSLQQRMGRGRHINATMTDWASAARTEKPVLIEIDGTYAPQAPGDLPATGLDLDELANLVLRTANTVPHFETDWMATTVVLPPSLVVDLLESLKHDRLVEVMGQTGAFSHRWAITDAGRERASRLMEICGYLGPAPVTLGSYIAFLDWQFSHLPDVTPREIARVTAALVLPETVVEVAGLAALSKRSLFLYGPPGNGKTSIGCLISDALKGELWIPHAIQVGTSVIRVFDPQVHKPAPPEAHRDELRLVDHRWVRIERPFIVAAGELRLDDLDLGYNAGLGYYEAPVHMKANGGIFMIDDFGFQRDNPFQLLNRWVFPLEHEIDFLTLKSGQKLFVPFRQMLIISTNLDPNTVMEPAILRRMGYRLHLGNPTAEQYAEIFDRCAAEYQAEVPYGLIEWLLHRYEHEERPARSCEPRDLIERVRDICRFRGQPMHLDEELLDTAWRGYFGERVETDEGPSWM